MDIDQIEKLFNRAKVLLPLIEAFEQNPDVLEKIVADIKGTAKVAADEAQQPEPKQKQPEQPEQPEPPAPEQPQEGEQPNG